MVVYLRARHKASIGQDEFLALGLIALTYGLTVVSHTYGFLAVLAAGMALQRVKENAGAVPLPAASQALMRRQAEWLAAARRVPINPARISGRPVPGRPPGQRKSASLPVSAHKAKLIFG